MEIEIKTAVRQIYHIESEPVVTRPDSSLGDYSTNIALQIAGSLSKRPIDVANDIANSLRDSGKYDDVSVAGPGFINFRLNSSSLINAINKKPAKANIQGSVVLEYSCPNAFKELHTGHLYQTIFGDILGNLLSAGEVNVHRTSFSGDVGLHVAKCLWGIIETLGGIDPSKLSKVPDSAFERSRWISNCYVKGSLAYEEDEAAKNSIDSLNKDVYGFHENDDRTSPLAAIYWETREWSFDYFKAFYKKIKVNPLHFYAESATAPTGMNIVSEQLNKGNLVKSKGAIVFEGDESKHLHTRVFVTSKGLPTYETKDIGVIWQEKDDYDFSKRILITGGDQREYMRVVFAAAETFRPELKDMMTHLISGTVHFGDGNKMSSRLGNVTRAVDVIESVEEKVKSLLKVPDPKLIEQVTLGAVKYAFAKYKFGGDISFDVDETVSLNGNSGPYIQYAHARACSILAKAPSSGDITDAREEDRLLLLKLGEYSTIIEKAMTMLEPHHICNYLFELSQEFNRYYENNKVIGSTHELHRLRIVQKYAKTLSDGLALLGIESPGRM